MSTMRLEIRDTWDGTPCPTVQAVVELSARAGALVAEIEATYHGDAPPDHPPGATPRLWEHEVVELFVLGSDARYIEIELGPHGHWLGYALEGPRNVVDPALPLSPSWGGRVDGRWSASVEIPAALLPSDANRLAAFAIFGAGEARRHHAWKPPLRPGPAPDFHRLDAFGAMAPELSLALKQSAALD
jgi:hypothetical protein